MRNIHPDPGIRL